MEPPPPPTPLRLAPNATLRYLPVPKTGSEATRRFLGRFNEVYYHIGTHKMNVGLPRIRLPWNEADSVRVATWRDPVERFLSTLHAILDGPLPMVAAAVPHAFCSAAHAVLCRL